MFHLVLKFIDILLVKLIKLKVKININIKGKTLPMAKPFFGMTKK
jgi:hypothetical protein